MPSIWRQFDRVNNNTVIEDTGATYYNPNGSPVYVPDDLQVEYRSYAKYPRDKFTTLLPPRKSMKLLVHINRSDNA